MSCIRQAIAGIAAAIVLSQTSGIQAASAQSTAVQSVSDKIDELSTLRKSVTQTLEAVVAYGQQGDRSTACQQSKYAQSQLTQMDNDVRYVTAAVAGNGFDSSDRASWAVNAEKVSRFIREEREVAMADWQRSC